MRTCAQNEGAIENTLIDSISCQNVERGKIHDNIEKDWVRDEVREKEKEAKGTN